MTYRKRRTAAGGALAALVLFAPGTVGGAAADESGDPDSVSDDAVANAVTGIATESHIIGIDLTGSIEKLETEETEGSTTTVTISADVLFEFDEATLTGEAEKSIADIAERLEGVSGTVEVVGHSDGVGGDDYNQTLSEERAESVKDALEEELGSAAPDIGTEGRGASDPIADETDADGADDPAGRAKNRRVEISFDEG